MFSLHVSYLIISLLLLQTNHRIAKNLIYVFPKVVYKVYLFVSRILQIKKFFLNYLTHSVVNLEGSDIQLY